MGQSPLDHQDLGAMKLSGGNCRGACMLLLKGINEKWFHGRIFFPNGPHQTSAHTYQPHFWSSQQNEITPTCGVQPFSAEDVSFILRVAKDLRCPFAVKSGGHACFAGASNIPGGLTIELTLMRGIEVATDQTVTRIGAGNKWGDVYKQLDSMNLSVIGGRVGDVGVGGLTLGGGISFYSGMHGWACDNVVNYEVILANCSIANINYTSYPDLFFALRGGGNNFGIITRFDLSTFSQGLLWGGAKAYRLESSTALFEALEDFNQVYPADPYAATWTATYYIPQTGYMISTMYVYAKPEIDPPIFAGFRAIKDIFSDVKVDSLANITIALDEQSPPGFRESYATGTFKNSALLSSRILDIYLSEIELIKDTVAGLLAPLVFQPITTAAISHMSKNGGNALGISLDDGPLILWSLSFRWLDAADDSRVSLAVNNIVARATEIAEEMGLHHRYIYQNYAAKDQDVFAGYGEENRRRLVQIQKAYDPDGVFELLQPGFFKLGGVGEAPDGVSNHDLWGW
ncbi:MAG: hypothetical protein M1827_007725 [Pycnora praestabilis]|nr:MAG: hypothetical protein M1827_007725 [Pycnora praestabilis]